LGFLLFGISWLLHGAKVITFEVIINSITMSEKIKVQELTIEGVVYVPKSNQISKVVEVSGEDSVWEIGKNYLIRTVTMIQIGTLVKVTEKELLLADACWVADTGRFSEAMAKGTLKEVEMFPGSCIVGRGAIVDAAEWIKSLPTETK
jgi:hypothetical protein